MADRELKQYTENNFVSTPVEEVRVGDMIAIYQGASGYTALPILKKYGDNEDGYVLHIEVWPGYSVNGKASVQWNGDQPLITIEQFAEPGKRLLILKKER